jgi:hypothetical protein
MRRATGVALAVIGPAAVGILRLLLPYYTAADNTATARAVIDAPGRENAVLWLGLIATLTLVPGLYAAREALAPSRLRDWSFGLTLLGYLCLPIVLIGDALLWTAADHNLEPATIARLYGGLHPTYDIALGVFILAHVIGTTLIGVLCLRTNALPPLVAWLLTISQPLHFVTTVFLGLAWLDLIAWMLTALAMGWLAVHADVEYAGPSSARSTMPVLRS